jgi:hypothetical protein
LLSPEDLQRRVSQRAVLDAYAARFHVVETVMEPNGIRPTPRYRPDERSVRVVKPKITDSILRHRLDWQVPDLMPPGFSAPILDRAGVPQPVSLSATGLTHSEQLARQTILDSLARDGLLLTLANTIRILGPDRFLDGSPDSTRELHHLGFPVDLLSSFQIDPSSVPEPGTVIAHVARFIAKGQPPEMLAANLHDTPFVFTKTHPSYRAANETGVSEIGLVRLQINGGYREGIIHGGCLDVAGQLIAALPQADFIATVPEELLENVRWLALHGWPLRRPHRLTLIPESSPFTPWAQDNGKAGALHPNGDGTATPATLVPRYASQEEIGATFVAGDSFLMDGLRDSGHAVLHSPLLFQGGNLLVVHDPRRNQRLLLLADTEVHRNRRLGLSPLQTIEAFRVEFGVDRCVVLPTVSYHLDYDVTVRSSEGELVAFVNDSHAAARLIVRRGIDAFEQAGSISNSSARSLRDQLTHNDHHASVIRALAETLHPFLNPKGQYRASLLRLFTDGAADSPVLNLQCFFAALDVLASTAFQNSDAPIDPLARDYFAALRELETTARAQRATLESLGWRVIPVPSMPDLHRSLNYINGLHDRSTYLMPSLGGFYAPLDDAAAAAFQRVLGDKIRVLRILSQDLQRHHGALHCVASAFPRTE